MILAAGLTPAWQQIVLLDGFQVGEVNRAREVRWCGSGKVLNVGLALHYLGTDSRTLTVVGGRNGASIQEEFDQLGIKATWIASGKGTRVCTTILDSVGGGTTELVEEAGSLDGEELAAFQDAFTREVRGAEVALLSGSLPKGCPAGFFRELMAGYRGRVILDVRGPELLEALGGQPFLVKPNREELSRTLGKELRNEGEVLLGMRELNRRGAEWVVVTAGGSPVLATSGEESYRFLPAQVGEVVNPIGCGDCLAAGIAWGLQAGNSAVESIRLGMGAAANNLAHLEPARLEPREVVRATGMIEVENIG